MLTPLPLARRLAWRAMRGGLRGARIYQALARFLSSPPRGRFIRLPDGSVIANRNGDRVVRDVLQGGYERAELATLLSLLSPGSTFIDVGANLGFYTIPAAHAVGPSGRVIALEPGPAHDELVEAISLSALDNVDVRRLGAAEFEGSCTLNEIIGQSGLTSFRTRQGITATSEIPVSSLDAVARAGGVGRVSVLKIDTEGYEGPVLRGASALLSNNQVDAVLIELSPVISDDCGIAEVVALLRKGWRGYEIYERGAFRSIPMLVERDEQWLLHQPVQVNVLLKAPLSTMSL